MSIGTAKPSAQELGSVPHYFINSHSIRQEFNAGDYEEEALKLLDKLFLEKNIVILTGGSGLYIKAVTEGFDDLPKAAPGVREQLNKKLEEEGLTPLREQLEQLDPIYHQEVDLNNPQRIIRALEVCLSTGRPFSSYKSSKKKDRAFGIIKIGLTEDRQELYDRINKRVDMMIQSGLVEEVKALLPYRHLNALQTVGYAEIFDFLDGKITLDKAVDLIMQNTRRYAKRQLTWLRREQGIRWFKPEEINSMLEYIQKETGFKPEL